MDARPAFETIVGDYYAGLYRFGLSLTRNEADACDLVQQTFSIYARKGHRIRDPEKIKSWLFTTLRREFFATRRRAERFADEPPDEATTPDLSPARLESLDGEAVLEAMGSLPLEYREPLALFYLEDFTYQEIADHLDIPIGTVMSRLSRAKSKLRNLLDHESP